MKVARSFLSLLRLSGRLITRERSDQARVLRRAVGDLRLPGPRSVPTSPHARALSEPGVGC